MPETLLDWCEVSRRGVTPEQQA